MNEEYKSLQDNDVWDLVPLLKGVKPIGCKWIFKTKRDLKGDVERYKTCLVAKGFTQKEDIDFKETFSPISTKNSFRVVMALVAYFVLELYQMDVKITFLNGHIDETIYMVQSKNFVFRDPKKIVCKLKKCIYGLKQASRQWYYKFHQVIISFGFEIIWWIIVYTTSLVGVSISSWFCMLMIYCLPLMIYAYCTKPIDFYQIILRW